MSKRPDCCKDCIHSFTGHCYGCAAFDPTDEAWVKENDKKQADLAAEAAEEMNRRLKFINEQYEEAEKTRARIEQKEKLRKILGWTNADFEKWIDSGSEEDFEIWLKSLHIEDENAD